MARHHKGRKMREFSYLNERYVSKNYLKYYKHAIRDISGRTGLTMNEINVMVFMYDYEFFTATHMSQALYQSDRKFRNKVLYPLQQIERASSREKVKNRAGCQRCRATPSTSQELRIIMKDKTTSM